MMTGQGVQLMTATTDTTYQGWKNYETWAVKLWIDNERPDYELWRERTAEVWTMAEDEKPDYMSRSEWARFHLADEIHEWADVSAPELQGFYTDLLNAALGEVDWVEIADNLLSDTEGYEAQS
jgi:hypothetical protein